MSVRVLHVGAARMARWVSGFEDRHGAAERLPVPGGVRLAAADGSTADLVAPFGAGTADRAGGDPVAELIAEALRDRTVPVLLLRRGGYACAVVVGDRVTASKVGSRYVQGRTAAGGWSQQRFARRREGQARELVGVTADVAVRLLLPVAARADALATGGDAALVGRCLADPRLGPVAGLPRGPHLDVGDPRSDTVRALPARLREIRVTLAEAG